MTTHQESVHAQFDPRAQAYLKSAVHARGPDLDRARALVSQAIPAQGQGIDIGCGAGHLSFALAPGLARMVALDPSAAMLETVRNAAAAQGLANIETRQGCAEALPFPDATFCFAATRYSAHHWLELGQAMAEMRRVVRPGGYVLVVDVETSHNPLVDTHFQTLELLRDKSHVRNRSDFEWRRHFQDAGIHLLEHAVWPVRIDFVTWGERMRTPAEKIAMIRTLQAEAPNEVRDALAFEADGSFTLQTGLWWGQVPH